MRFIIPLLRLKIVLFFSCFMLLSQSNQAQIIRASSDSLNFGSVNVGDKDSMMLTLQNRDTASLQVSNVKFYTIYNDFPFSASANSFSIPGRGSYQLWIYFEPVHNILNNSELIIQHNANSGVESVDLRGQGVFPNAYYNITQNLEEEALKTALKNRIALNYNQLSYSAARDAMFMTIDNKLQNGQAATTNTLECVYTGYNKTAYTSRSDAQTTNPNFNTEHTFPQGFFNSSLPERSDIHHLFPTTNNSNSQRGNKAFGVVTNGSPVTLGGGSFYNSTTFEPRNAQKGKTARAMMYFVIRYQDFSNHFGPQENILRNWHNTYPPDSIERRRNDDIYTVQNNRNPFVDYPQLEERITNFVTTSTKPVLNGLDITQTSIDFGTMTNQLADSFEYVIVNRGNQDVTFSNFSLSNTNLLSFCSGFGGNLTIKPGDALIIPMIFNSFGNYNLSESLSFNTSIPGGQSSFTIPIRGNSILVGLDDQRTLEEIEVYPNPFDELIKIENPSNTLLEIQLFDLKGRSLHHSSSSEGNIQLTLDKLEKGSYLLKLKSEAAIRMIKLVK